MSRTLPNYQMFGRYLGRRFHFCINDSSLGLNLSHKLCYITNRNWSVVVNSDGDFCIVPQQGALDIQTEFSSLFVQPGEICVIQHGQRFLIKLPGGQSRGYILEIWGSNFELPELRPLGANGLENARDFLHPTAKYEITQEPWDIVYKLAGKYFKSMQNHSPPSGRIERSHLDFRLSFIGITIT